MVYLNYQKELTMTNILVCDDDKEIVDAIEIYLNQEGFQVRDGLRLVVGVGGRVRGGKELGHASNLSAACGSGKARHNEKCRMTHCPKRFWADMVEMKDEF